METTCFLFWPQYSSFCFLLLEEDGERSSKRSRIKSKKGEGKLKMEQQLEALLSRMCP
jgi:hypothetical protein